jgi:hypothetical protein
MVEQIGNDAGVVWHYLDENGETTLTQVAKATGLKQRQVDRALGWLAREGKITLKKKSKTEIIILSEAEPVT